MGRQSRQQRRTQARRRQDTKHGGVGNRAVLVGLGIALVAAAILGFLAFGRGSTGGNGGTSRAVAGGPVDGIRCENAMGQFHTHASIRIYNHGQPVTVPANIGINQGQQCMYWLHTHSADGLIHNEAPGKNRVTLGNFFHVWGETLSSMRISTLSPKSGERIAVFVNGKPYSGDPRGIVLRNHADVVIDVGPPYRNPARFTYPPT